MAKLFSNLLFSFLLRLGWGKVSAENEMEKRSADGAAQHGGCYYGHTEHRRPNKRELWRFSSSIKSKFLNLFESYLKVGSNIAESFVFHPISISSRRIAGPHCLLSLTPRPFPTPDTPYSS